MASCVVRDWQGKEAGKATLDLKVAKETTAVDLMHRAVLRQQAYRVLNCECSLQVLQQDLMACLR